MPKSLFENELMMGMEKEMRKQASSAQPNLAEAAECLHAALEIFEGHGMHARADQVLQILEKLAQTKLRPVEKMPSIKTLMEAGLTQRDMHEFSKGNPIAKAKFNLVLRQLGLSDHQISQFLGHGNVMSEEDAKTVLDPNRGYSKMWDWMRNPTESPALPADREQVEPGQTLEFKSIAGVKKKSSDPATKGWTPEKGVKALKEYGIPMKPTMSDDGQCAVDIPEPLDKHNVTEKDIDPQFSDLFDVFKSENFDIDASDDELMGMDINDDTIEVSELDAPLEDFEDERH
jgi:hypothetical protein